MIPIRVVEYLLDAPSAGPLAEKLNAAKKEGKKSISVRELAERAYLANAAWTREGDTSPYIKGWRTTLRVNEPCWLGMVLKDKVVLTALWTRYWSAKQAERNLTPIELAREFVRDASDTELAELSGLTGLPSCHPEILANILVWPAL